MSEDQELLLKISQISGQINLRKNQQDTSHVGERRQSWTPVRGAPYGQPPLGRGRGRAGRVLPPPRRNRTLILNNPSDSKVTNSSPSLNDRSAAVEKGGGDQSQPGSQPGSAQGWIAKHDRHRQLINPAIYEREMLARTRDLETTRQLKAAQKDEREKAKIQRHLESLSRGTQAGRSTTGSLGERAVAHQLNIHGVPFRVTNSGSRLVRAMDAGTLGRSTPKSAVVGGVTFVRSKHGNLYRAGIVKNKRLGRPVKKIAAPCKQFTTTGSCLKGPLCPYTHDHTKVAICKDYLQTGACPANGSCDLSHEATAQRVPACLHFLRGKCSNPDCRYAHVRVNPGAPVCRAFASLGFCDRGADCTERHVFECPDYANSGTCNNKKCRLPHIDRAGRIRKMAATAAAESNRPAQEMMKDDDGQGESDISSDGEEIDSDDVDSEGLVEDLSDFPEDPQDPGISGQQDYIHL